ncbi:segmentation protein cap'n'collar [Rhagoletis pomonella]|uniref:segmentation protein cap'n'collar n=1 Tax=Rhagoletis pomonella TaxID=28610 RepID=UPI00177D55DB|nr:segmentation protein cap'n'collar [Rhagoletis pomonella]
MICNKKSYAMKMLQIALALSLLHVDPDNYLQQRLRNWDSQLELRDGDGWELEMLRAVPMVEYPYANRKTMMPLIEDLIRYDRQHDATLPQYNVTAYILNVQNDGGTNQTATLPELQTTASSAANAGGSVNVAGATALEQAANAAAAAAAASTNATNMGLPASELDVFLNSDNFQDQRSVWEQNLADLRDFGDLAINNPYAGLPLKDEPYNNTYIDLNLDAFLPTIASAATAAANAVKKEDETISAGALNDTYPEPADIASIKTEQFDKEEEEEIALENEVASSSSSSSTLASTVLAIKKEPEASGDDGEQTESEEVDLSPFISQTELIEEESEIIDVLWKQDVDLGYTLTPPHLLNSSSNGKVAVVSDDDIEKLKALEYLKLDQPNFEDKDANVSDIDDEWAGIPFTVDNETAIRFASTSSHYAACCILSRIYQAFDNGV